MANERLLSGELRFSSSEISNISPINSFVQKQDAGELLLLPFADKLHGAYLCNNKWI